MSTTASRAAFVGPVHHRTNVLPRRCPSGVAPAGSRMSSESGGTAVTIVRPVPDIPAASPAPVDVRHAVAVGSDDPVGAPAVGSGRAKSPVSARLPASVWVLAAVALVVALAFGILVPAIALLARDFGVGRTAVGLAVSAFAFFRFVTAPLGGRLVSRFGERAVLITGLLIVALTSGVSGFAPSFVVFVPLRAAGGAGSAMFTIAAITLLLRVAPPQARGRATATFSGRLPARRPSVGRAGHQRAAVRRPDDRKRSWSVRDQAIASRPSAART